jgi:orotate phosphoribosyltransferase
MIYNKTVSLQTAEYLLGIKAVKLSPRELFTWASGIKSPIYCDNRITLSFPAIRTFIKENFVNAIAEKFEKPDVIAGVATGGIPQGALVADDMGLPFVYVRSGKKDHGLTNLIEGRIEPGQKVVVVEDLISTGSSSLEAVKALQATGCVVVGMVAIFTYNLPISVERFIEVGCPLVTLTDYKILIEKALKTGYIDEGDLQVLRDFIVSLAGK